MEWKFSFILKILYVDDSPQERSQPSRADWSDQLPDVPQQDRGGRALRCALLYLLLRQTSGLFNIRCLDIQKSDILFQGAIQEVSELDEVSEEIKIPTLNFPLLPTVLITLAAYLISSCFFSVYEMAIDTLFLCFLQDSEINDGSKEKPFYMSKYISNFI